MPSLSSSPDDLAGELGNDSFADRYDRRGLVEREHDQKGQMDWLRGMGSASQVTVAELQTRIDILESLEARNPSGFARVTAEWGQGLVAGMTMLSVTWGALLLAFGAPLVGTAFLLLALYLAAKMLKSFTPYSMAMRDYPLLSARFGSPRLARQTSKTVVLLTMLLSLTAIAGVIAIDVAWVRGIAQHWNDGKTHPDIGEESKDRLPDGNSTPELKPGDTDAKTMLKSERPQ